MYASGKDLPKILVARYKLSRLVRMLQEFIPDNFYWKLCFFVRLAAILKLIGTINTP